MTETRTKVDLRKELAHLYRPPAKKVVEVEVPEMRFIMADGAGDPNTSRAFAEAVEALYAVSYTLKFTVRNEDGIDYGVMPLEGLWWTDMEEIELAEIPKDRDSWRWTVMIMQPGWVTEERFGLALASVGRKKGLPGLSRLRFEAFHEGWRPRSCTWDPSPKRDPPSSGWPASWKSAAARRGANTTRST